MYGITNTTSEIMKKIIFILIGLTFLTSCTGSDGYEVIVNDSSIDIYVSAPSYGIVGINTLSYGGCDLHDIDEMVYDRLNSFYTLWGIIYNDYFPVTLYYTKTDDYGHKVAGKIGEIGNIYKSNVKKYASSDYYREVSDLIYKAYEQGRYPSEFKSYSKNILDFRLAGFYVIGIIGIIFLIKEL